MSDTPKHEDCSYCRVSYPWPVGHHHTWEECAANLINDCAPYLKEGESPAECIARNRKDADMLLGELAKERRLVERFKSAIASTLPSGMAELVMEDVAKEKP